MNINRLIAVSALTILSIILSDAQSTVEIHVDTVQKRCSIIEINHSSKTFSQDFINDCKKARIFDLDNGRILARWDSVGWVHITLFSKPTITRGAVEYTIAEKGIAEILSIGTSIEKHKSTINGRKLNRSVFNVEYIDDKFQKCSVQWDKDLLIALDKPICKSVEN